MSKVKDTKKVAEACQRLYSDGQKEQRTELVSFLEKHVPESDRKELDDQLRKTVPVSGRPLRGKRKKGALRKCGGNKVQPAKRREGRLLTARERRQLGLNRLPKVGLKYSDLVPMNKLWLEYVAGLVDFSKGVDDGARVRLCRADYHGAAVKVTKSGNSDVVGVEGIVAAETRNTFAVLGQDNVLRTVPKKATSFTFRAGPQYVFTVGGSNMMMKPSERAVKKWKSRGPLDLW